MRDFSKNIYRVLQRPGKRLLAGAPDYASTVPLWLLPAMVLSRNRQAVAGEEDPGWDGEEAGAEAGAGEQ